MSQNELPALEASHRANGHWIVGVDEVGRGCLAGSVYASACILNYEKTLALDPKSFAWIRDSKTLSAKQRAKMLPVLEDCIEAKQVAIAETHEIDELNILQASFLAMRRAVQNLLSSFDLQGRSVMVLVDGRQTIPKLGLMQAAVVGGDSKVKAIAAASIFAKQARDHYMHGMDQRFPGYGFAKNVGYGTKQHMDALKELGPIAIHRRSFAPVRKSLRTR